jgi:transcriptional regulator with XRE-family HTH domain
MAGVSANDAAATTFGEQLRDHRRAAGLTQEELAERAGVSPRSISGLERGDAPVPRRDTVAARARARPGGLTAPKHSAPSRRGRAARAAPPIDAVRQSAVRAP